MPLVKDRPQQLDDCRQLLRAYEAKADKADSGILSVPNAALPTYADLLQIDWIDSVWAMHDDLKQSGDSAAEGLAIAENYLRLQHSLNTNPRPLVESNGPSKGGHARLDVKTLETLLETILHPYQVPLTLEAIRLRLQRDHGFVVCY